jgi:hypothetical protein
LYPIFLVGVARWFGCVFGIVSWMLNGFTHVYWLVRHLGPDVVVWRAGKQTKMTPHEACVYGKKKWLYKKYSF